ncbi:MAG: glycosyltransferase family 39 protein, partial [Anaerolineales bacterium]
MATQQFWQNHSSDSDKANQKFPSLLKEIAWHLAIPLVLLFIVFFFFPSRERFEFSTDEGLELMKSFLVTKDYSLYDQIWNDQPPGLTYLLVASMKFFGFGVMTARYTVLVISCILLWAVVQILRTIWGGAHAIAGALLLLILPQYLVLSVSVMRGLPAIAFAMVSLYMLVKWHYSHKYAWLLLSSITL